MNLGLNRPQLIIDSNAAYCMLSRVNVGEENRAKKVFFDGTSYSCGNERDWVAQRLL